MAGRYNDDEMKEILRRALESEESADGIDHEDLVAAAAEVGIDRSLVERAAVEMRDESAALARVEQKQRKRRRGFFKSFATFAVINAFLFAIDYLTPGGPWFYWPLLGWGMFVALHGLKVLPPMSADTKREAVEAEKRRIVHLRAKEARRRAREADKRARRERGDRRSSAESAFESAVEEGVTALLSALAGQLSRATGASGAAGHSDFDRYVEKRRGAQHARPSAERIPSADVPVDSTSPRARVSIEDAAIEVVEEELEALRRRERR
jgi:hypothetical protein